MVKSHTPDEALEAYALGVLADNAAVEDHLLTCERCRARLESVCTFVRAMNAAYEEDAARKR